MNKIGIHYGSFVSDWTEDQFSLIARVKDLGFDLVEVGSDYLLSLDESGLKRLRDESQAQGVDVAISLGLSLEQDIAAPDEGVRNEGSGFLIGLAKAMAAAGVSDCSGIVFSAWNGKIGSYEEKKSRWKTSVACMKEIIKTYEENGVYLNVEVTNRFENYLINSCDEAIAYTDEVGSPNLGIHLDTFHMNIEEDSFTTPIVNAGKKMRFFHVGENNRKMPGLGMLPWKTIFDALKIADYTGPISMEPFVRPGGDVGSAVSLYREIMDLSDYENDLKRSLAFVRSMMK